MATLRAGLSLALVVGLEVASGVAQSPKRDLVSYPATGELDIVFPRNETYAVEAPFPVILGFQNAPVMLDFDSVIVWSVKCENGTMSGYGNFGSATTSLNGADTHYYINASDAVAPLNDGGDKFEYWRGDSDKCTLEWLFDYGGICEPQSNGDVKVKIGSFKTRSGNVTFTIRPGATRPQDAIAKYSGCATAGTAIQVAGNLTNLGCPQLADNSEPSPSPCKLDVSGDASSLAKAVVKPTTSLTSVPTTTTTTRTTDSTGVSKATGGASDTEGSATGSADGTSNSGDADNGSGAQATLGVAGGAITAVIAFIAGGALLLL